MSAVKIYKELDLSSASCAGPIGELSGVVEELQPGEAVKVYLGDEGTKKDVEAWAKRRNLKVLESKVENGKYVLVIAK
jgi:TusA-related sulfurtransferase